MSKNRRRWIIGGVAAFLAALALYPVTRNTWLIHRARTSFAEGKDRQAALQAMRLIQIDSNYTPAATLLADIAEKNLSRDALRWRISATKTDPSAATQIALALTSIHFQEWEWADQALLAVEPKDRNTANYLQTVGSLALAQRRYREAADFFEKAALLEPGNKTLKLNLAVIRLTLRDPELQAQGRKDLEQFKTQPDTAIPALLALIQDAAARQTPVRPLVDELLTHPCGFAEYFAALNALGQTKDPGVDTLLANIQKNFAKEPGEIYALSNWMVRQNRAAEAKAWLDSLQPEERVKAPVPMAYAECLVSLHDWKTLQDNLSKTKWADAEIMRHAFLWRAERELSPISRQETGLSDWMNAMRGEAVRPAELYLAASLFWSWGWKTEAEDLWWNLAAQAKNPDIALRTLDQIFRAEKNTRKLWWVSQRAQQNNPRDKIARNNYAMLSLLLGLDQQNANAFAESLYRELPKNPAFLSTYAFSLHRRGQNKEAVRLFSTLDPKVLAIPEFAFYYAVFLKADGQDKEAARYAKMAEKADLLPEEKALLQ